jgi:hypothetical protein
MRTHPQGIRSVVLDPVEPPGVNALTGVLTGAARGFTTLFNGCAADRACATAFPDLRGTFTGLVRHLNAAPATIPAVDPTTHQVYSVLLTGDRLVALLRAALYVTPLIPDLPLMLDQAAGDDDQCLTQIYGPLLLTERIQLGVFLSVECSEDARSPPRRL